MCYTKRERQKRVRGETELKVKRDGTMSDTFNQKQEVLYFLHNRDMGLMHARQGSATLHQSITKDKRSHCKDILNYVPAYINCL